MTTPGLGRRIAREQFATVSVSNDNRPQAVQEDGAGKDQTERQLSVCHALRSLLVRQPERKLERGPVRLCRGRARSEQWEITGTCHDAAISGANMILRPGIRALLQDAQRGVFDVVRTEAHRLARDRRAQSDTRRSYARSPAHDAGGGEYEGAQHILQTWWASRDLIPAHIAFGEAIRPSQATSALSASWRWRERSLERRSET